MDDNDRLRAGTLSKDPMEGTVVVQEPAQPTGDSLADLLDDAVARMNRRKDGEEKPIPTRWPAVNKALSGGLWPGLVTLTGNTGAGKTQFALEIARHAATRGIPVAYVSLEMDTLGLVCRLMALEYRHGNVDDRREGITWSKLYTGKCDYLGEVIGATRAPLARMNLRCVEGTPGAWSAADLQQLVESMREQHPKDQCPTILVVVDFLQLVGPDPASNGREELRERIGQAAYMARDLARKHDAVVLMLSSTARSNYKTLTGEDGGGLGVGDPGRLVGLGKESGEIEHAADLALALCQERRKAGEQMPPVYLAVAKQRAGTGAWVELTFDGCCFDEAKPSGGKDSGGEDAQKGRMG